jgi:hypothetical protein
VPISNIRQVRYAIIDEFAIEGERRHREFVHFGRKDCPEDDQTERKNSSRPFGTAERTPFTAHWQTASELEP